MEKEIVQNAILNKIGRLSIEKDEVVKDFRELKSGAANFDVLACKNMMLGMQIDYLKEVLSMIKDMP